MDQRCVHAVLPWFLSGTWSIRRGFAGGGVDQCRVHAVLPWLLSGAWSLVRGVAGAWGAEFGSVFVLVVLNLLALLQACFV